MIVIIWPAAGWSAYWSHTILLETFIFGMAAASLVFLSAYGGMVSLAQTALFGIAGIIVGNLATKGGPGGTSKGLHLGWDPTVAVIVALLLTTVIALIGGAVAARSAGIYFLMITLTYSVIAWYALGQVTNISGFSGIGGINSYTPGWIGNILAHPNRLYYIALGVTVFAYVVIRYLVRTPFGLALQGVRDEPIRAASLGYNVPLHRTLSFGFAGFIAALAGILYAWFAGQVVAGRRRPADDDQPADHGRDRRARPNRGSVGRRLRVLRDAELHHHDHARPAARVRRHALRRKLQHDHRNYLFGHRRRLT